MTAAKEGSLFSNIDGTSSVILMRVAPPEYFGDWSIEWPECKLSFRAGAEFCIAAAARMEVPQDIWFSLAFVPPID